MPSGWGLIRGGGLFRHFKKGAVVGFLSDFRSGDGMRLVYDRQGGEGFFFQWSRVGEEEEREKSQV